MVLADRLPGGEVLGRLSTCGLVRDHLCSFRAMFKVLPDVTVAWSDVSIGAVVTAVLFVLASC